MCGSMVDIQSATDENGQGKKKKELECWQLACQFPLGAFPIDATTNPQSNQQT